MRKFFRCTRGGTAIEYGLVAALISILAITSMMKLGSKIQNVFTNTAAGFSTIK